MIRNDISVNRIALISFSTIDGECFVFVVGHGVGSVRTLTFYTVLIIIKGRSGAWFVSIF